MCSIWRLRRRNGPYRARSRLLGPLPIASLANRGRRSPNGFLGLPSLGRSTFTTVADATAADLGQIEQLLTGYFISACGAPDEAAARFAAAEETSFVRELCRDAPINTVFTVRRTWDAQGQIKEEFRTIRPPTGEPLHAKIWTVVDDEA